MKIVLDANVIIAAVAARGLCAEILSLVLSRHDLILSEEIWGEIRKSLRSKIKVPAAQVKGLEELLRGQGHWMKPLPVSVAACRDTGDLHVLGSVEASGAEFLVSGDKDLIVLKAYKGTKIVTPREFWVLQRG